MIANPFPHKVVWTHRERATFSSNFVTEYFLVTCGKIMKSCLLEHRSQSKIWIRIILICNIYRSFYFWNTLKRFYIHIIKKLFLWKKCRQYNNKSNNKTRKLQKSFNSLYAKRLFMKKNDAYQTERVMEYLYQRTLLRTLSLHVHYKELTWVKCFSM